VLGERRQLVSAMHALLENAITYSYDNSKVVVSGTVRRTIITHPAQGFAVDTAPAPLPPVEAAFTPEVIDDDGTPPTGTPVTSSPETSAATSSTAPSVPDSEQPAVGGTESVTAQKDWRNEERDNVCLSVQDHGIGIPARDLDRIFERFYRVDHGRSRDTGGTGLGLSIVRHVAHNHLGWVDVESREGEGSTFSLVLPLQAERVV
jgi:signal transduction histidine kinase